MTFNHELKEIAVKYSSKTGSRHRVRVPVAGVRHVGFKPGDRVHVIGYKKVSLISTGIKSKARTPGTYTVEKDGAIRIPAVKFGLPTSGITVNCDRYSDLVEVF
jgi:protein involved in polysaccharide export with SLBB domain